MKSCNCSSIQIGTKTSEHKNLNPNCPLHGFNSDWYQSKEQVERRQKQSERLKALQLQAKKVCEQQKKST